MILDETFSKEPLGRSSVDGDSDWFDAVNWAVIATIQAEEFGITSANVDEMITSDNPDILRLPGPAVGARRARRRSRSTPASTSNPSSPSTSSSRSATTARSTTATSARAPRSGSTARAQRPLDRRRPASTPRPTAESTSATEDARAALAPTAAAARRRRLLARRPRVLRVGRAGRRSWSRSVRPASLPVRQLPGQHARRRDRTGFEFLDQPAGFRIPYSDFRAGNVQLAGLQGRRPRTRSWRPSSASSWPRRRHCWSGSRGSRRTGSCARRPTVYVEIAAQHPAAAASSCSSTTPSCCRCPPIGEAIEPVGLVRHLEPVSWPCRRWSPTTRAWLYLGWSCRRLSARRGAGRVANRASGAHRRAAPPGAVGGAARRRGGGRRLVRCSAALSTLSLPAGRGRRRSSAGSRIDIDYAALTSPSPSTRPATSPRSSGARSWRCPKGQTEAATALGLSDVPAAALRGAAPGAAGSPSRRRSTSTST